MDEAAAARARREGVGVVELAQRADGRAVARVVREDLRHAPRLVAHGGGLQHGEREERGELRLYVAIKRVVQRRLGGLPAAGERLGRQLLERERVRGVRRAGAIVAQPRGVARPGGEDGGLLSAAAGGDVHSAICLVDAGCAREARLALHGSEHGAALDGAVGGEGRAALGEAALERGDPALEQAVLIDVERAARVHHVVRRPRGIREVLL